MRLNVRAKTQYIAGISNMAIGSVVAVLFSKSNQLIKCRIQYK